MSPQYTVISYLRVDADEPALMSLDEAEAEAESLGLMQPENIYCVEKIEKLWLVFQFDFDRLGLGNECLIVIHKDVVETSAGLLDDNGAIEGTFSPDDLANVAKSKGLHWPIDVYHFGPGTCASSLESIDSLHGDVNNVYTLVDEGYIDGAKAHLIFSGAKVMSHHTPEHPCASCGVSVPEDEALGYGGDYLCPDCFVLATSPEAIAKAKGGAK